MTDELQIIDDGVDESAFHMMVHAIGLDRHKPHKWCGELYYRAYRNYFHTPEVGDVKDDWDNLKKQGYAEKFFCNYYTLTARGLEYIAARNGIKRITEENIKWTQSKR